MMLSRSVGCGLKTVQRAGNNAHRISNINNSRCLVRNQARALPSVLTLHTKSSGDERQSSYGGRQSVLLGAAAVSAAAAFIAWVSSQQKAHCKSKSKHCVPGSVVDSLPTYKTEDIKKRNNPSSGIWVGFFFA